MINNLVNLAIEEKDHSTNIFLQWFVNEQVKEEKNVSDIVGKLKHINSDPRALYMVEEEVKQRVFTPPRMTEGDQ